MNRSWVVVSWFWMAGLLYRFVNQGQSRLLRTKVTRRASLSVPKQSVKIAMGISTGNLQGFFWWDMYLHPSFPTPCGLPKPFFSLYLVALLIWMVGACLWAFISNSVIRVQRSSFSDFVIIYFDSQAVWWWYVTDLVWNAYVLVCILAAALASKTPLPDGFLDVGLAPVTEDPS